MRPHIILGTAGHIDHGKTTLVKALTGIDTDRLKEEKERGITIELGFASLELPGGIHVGIVDVPGHERFVKNMVAGAAGVDVVAMVIAADEGVMPQTKEHLEICQLLGVKKGLVVLTKRDLVDEEWLELVKEDVAQFLTGTFLDGAPIVSVSSTTGEGIEEFLKTLQEILKEVEPRPPVGPYRLPVDRVFVKKGFGTVVTGTSISGRISVGDEATIYPKGIECKIRGIQMHGEEQTEAVPGFRTALNLQGVEKADVDRGDVVATRGSLAPSFLLDLDLIYLESAEKPLRYRAPVRFHCGTKEAIGRILIQGDEIEPGTTTFAQIKLEEPVCVLPGDRFVIRSYSPIRTIGGGKVLNPLPRRRRRTRQDLWEEMQVLRDGSPIELISYHLKQAGLRGLQETELQIRTGLYGKGLKKALNDVFGKKLAIAIEGEGRRILHQEAYVRVLKELVDVLEAYHSENPLSPGLSKEELRSRVCSKLRLRELDQRLFAKALQELSSNNDVIVDRDIVRLKQHSVLLGETEEELREKILSFFKKKGLKTVNWKEASSKFDGDEKQKASLLDLLIREGALVRLKDDLIFHREALEDLERKLVDYLKKHGEIGVPEFRDLTGGLSRKYLIPLLEYFDMKRVTIRIGDKRKLRSQ
ncbi:Selenocysteine-specific translation elongation factor [Dissulfuribacter thermophilus]|uniref:Selenocysteine-specific elongation factor n=1 Tax=Dissulfuribacter thermophilus TaxID=1156395 RepID=A0A1B9F6P7_9BACT|nr:selenocysteine-specific translation elongation factor [Dissulfuribacter thermophilus]OCC15570.1 Selenocysteine-specific translation elongation factor [Dissulfuribacter thermophilus]